MTNYDDNVKPRGDAPDGYVPQETIVDGSGASYRQIDYWTRRGYLNAEQRAARSGYCRWWPASEVPVARRMKALADIGMNLDVAQQAARAGVLNLAGAVRIEVA